MAKKNKGKPSSATKSTVIKCGKYRRDEALAKKESSASSSSHNQQAKSAKPRTAEVYDRELLALAERQMGKMKVPMGRKPPKPITIAPPTLILPAPAAQTNSAFNVIDQWLGEESNTASTQIQQPSSKSTKQSAAGNRFDGLSDSEEEKEVKPAFTIQPATFVWQR
eukprot:gene6665-7365_t